MKKVLSVLFLLVMLFTAVMPVAMAEDVSPAAEESVIGGADEPTAIVLTAAEETKEETKEETEVPGPLSIGEAALYMLKGMVGIFLVTGLIILVLVIMDKVGNRKKETEE